MMGLASDGREAQGRLERRSPRMMLDVDFALEGLVADLLRTELDQGGEVHLVLLRPRLGWSSDAALVVLHHRRIAVARSSRLEEVAHIAGARQRQVTPRSSATAGGRLHPRQSLASHLTHRPDQEGMVLR